MDGYTLSWASARVNAGKTQDEVASLMNVSKNTIINWEKYKSEPTISQALKLCEIYKAPIDLIDMNGSQRQFFLQAKSN